MINFIEVYDNALSSDQCQRIIDYFESSNEKERGVVGQGEIVRVDLSKKDSTDLIQMFSYENDITKLIHDSLYDHTQKYIKEYKDLYKITPWAPQNDFNIQRYLPGQGYKSTHCEHTAKEDTTVLAWMFYLNTVEDGGTKFTSYDLVTDCVEGRLVIWPAYWTHCHHGITSKTKTKYIATGWTCFI